MEDRAKYLLSLSDDILFRAGGCHVFALALRDFSKLPLLRVRSTLDNHDHLGCNPGDGCILDFYGYLRHRDYVNEGKFDGLGIYFSPTDVDSIVNRYTLGRGPGYYAHPDFLKPACERAINWILKNREYFDGTKKCMIPGIKRAD